VKSGWKDGIWTCTIDACSTVGSTSRGFTVVGKDKDGNEYVLGKGDFYVLDSDGIVKPGEQKWTMKLVAEKSDSPAKGDVFLDDDGSLFVYDGGDWQKVGGGASQEYVDAKADATLDAANTHSDANLADAKKFA